MPVPPQNNLPTQRKKTLAELLDIMAALRTPATGCPWDLVQTFASIAPYTIEEAYEVADAIERGDMAGLRQELGDLLLQVVYHARMAEEQGAFAFADVVDAIADKMLHRHPHVFGSAAERAAGAAPGFWDRIKGAEKAREAKPAAGVLDDVPVALPALTRAVKLQQKAAAVGFDWPSLKEVFDKLKEELGELEASLAPGPSAGDRTGTGLADQEAIAEELGDLLFVVANLARHLRIEPETVLRGANAKFERRFAGIERKLRGLGKTPRQSDLAEMDRLWDEVKAEEDKA
jgi:MazG family protein